MTPQDHVLSVYPKAVCSKSDNKYRVWASDNYWSTHLGAAYTEEYAWSAASDNLKNKHNENSTTESD